MAKPKDGHNIGKMPRVNLLMILKILEKHSDFDHPLSINEISELISIDFKRTLTPKTVMRILTEDLIDNEAFPLPDYYDVQMDEDKLNDFLKAQKIAKKEGEYCPYNAQIWYIIRSFDDSELQLLIDTLLYSEIITQGQCEGIIKKLTELSSIHFKIKHDSPFNASKNNHNLLYTLSTVREAINRSLKITFKMQTYGTDKNLHPVLEDGKAREYESFSPLEIVIKKGRYYMIGAFDTGGMYHFRCDFICDVRILEELKDEDGNIIKEAQKARPFVDVSGRGRELDIAKYLRERPHMFSGESTNVVFFADMKANPGVVYHILDHFENNVVFGKETDGAVKVTAFVNEQDFFYWALQFGMSVEILEPLELRERMRETVQGMLSKYEETHE